MFSGSTRSAQYLARTKGIKIGGSVVRSGKQTKKAEKVDDSGESEIDVQEDNVVARKKRTIRKVDRRDAARSRLSFHLWYSTSEPHIRDGRQHSNISPQNMCVRVFTA